MKLQPAMSRLAAVAVFLVAGTAQANILDARFDGTVNTQTNTSFSIGNAISGEFLYDTAVGRFLSFTIGGQTVAPGYTSSASITPDLYTALYQAQVSPLSGGTTNSTFVVDLEAINQWPSTNALALLQNAVQLNSNLDTTLSNFGFYNANADGTNIRSLNATLASIRVAAIPEPGTVALVVIGLSAIGLRGRRRSAR